MPTAGESTCPLCGRTWTVTPLDDCFVPACGHYGTDVSPANKERPCEPCGMAHMRECEGLPDEGIATVVPSSHPSCR
jgi:hypothetical protein